MGPHCVQALGLKKETLKGSVLEMSRNNQEEVCWGRKADVADIHEETRARAVVVVPEETGPSDGTEPVEPGAAGKPPMTRQKVLQESLLSAPYSVQVDAVTLRNNDTPAICPCSRSSTNSGVSLKFNHFRCHVISPISHYILHPVSCLNLIG